MKLYQLPYSHFSAKVSVVLFEKNLPYEAPPIPGGSLKSAEFLAINPLGKVPYLVDGETHVGESEVIVEYLEEKYPEPSLLPKTPPERAKSRWLSRFHDLYLAPQLSVLYGLTFQPETPAETVAEALDKLDEYLSLLESQLNPHPYMLGSQFYLCDASYCLSYIYIGYLTQKLGRPVGPEKTPKLTQWFEAASQRPSVQKVIAALHASMG